MTPEELDVFYEVVAGEGVFRLLGKGFWTYPAHNRRQERLYLACCQLEAQGRLRRQVDDGEAVLFVPREGGGAMKAQEITNAHEVFDRAEARQAVYAEAHVFLAQLRAQVTLPPELQGTALSLLARMDNLAKRRPQRPRGETSDG
jgi:hypothetical protein